MYVNFCPITGIEIPFFIQEIVDRSIAAHFIMPLKDCNFRNMQRPILKLPIESFSLYPVVSLLVKYPDETTSSEVVAIDKENGIEDRVSFKEGRIRNNSFG